MTKYRPLPHHYVIFLLTCTPSYFFFFFFNDPATPEIYPLPLHDALPICCLSAPQSPTPLVPWRGPPPRESGPGASQGYVKPRPPRLRARHRALTPRPQLLRDRTPRYQSRDRKSTRLNSSHDQISYAVFCL